VILEVTFEQVAKRYDDFYPLRFQILVDGKDIQKEKSPEVTAVSFDDTLEGSSHFSFSVNDPKMELMDSTLFEAGKLVEIKMFSKEKAYTMVLGEIISLRPSFPSDGGPNIEVSGYDLLYQFTRGARNNTWEGPKKDSEVVEAILKGSQARHKLKVHVEQTKVVYPKIIQDNETDFAFMRRLADRNFFDFYIERDEVYFCPPKIKSPIMTLEYGKGLLSFTPELNTADQISEVVVRGWNPSTKKEIVATAKNQKSPQGQSGGEAVAKIYGKVETRVTSMPITSQQEADILARSILNKKSVGLVRGNAECIGIPEIRAGRIINLTGLGKNFSQKYFIEKTTHNISSSGYSTTFAVRGDII
jgi:phage protein D